MDMTVDLEPTRQFVAGRFCFTVATSDPADRVLIERLFQDLARSGSGDSVTGVFEMRRRQTEAGLRWAMNGPRLDVQPELSLVSALTRLMGAVNLCALDADSGSLHLHAAAAIKNERAVVIAAQRNTGKTTTVAHLVARGWAFVTDETVSLRADREEIGGFPKPLSIKPGGDRLVEHLEQWMIPPVAEGTESYRFVPIGASGVPIAAGGQPHLVVLLRRPQGEKLTSQAQSRMLHPADAVVALMQETLDAERFGQSAARLATLAAATRCYEVTIGSPEETARTIEELAEPTLAKALDVKVLSHRRAIAEGVVSVAIGDRMVVHHRVTGQIFALDAAATRVWEQLGGWHDHGIDLAEPVVGPFVERLRALGVLAEGGTIGVLDGGRDAW